MLRTSKLDIDNSVNTEAVKTFLDDADWVVCLTYHTVNKSMPGVAIFDRDILFDIPYLADWNKIGENRQA